MGVQRVLVDANVLYSRTLRDWMLLLRLEADGMYVVLTTEDILTEVLYHFRRRRPHADGGDITRLAEHLRENMDEIIADYRIDASYPGEDPHDGHVHAAAVDGRADCLVTSDTRLLEMPGDELPYEISTPDAFLTLANDSAPRAVSAVVREQRSYAERRGYGKTLDQALRDAGCPTFARCIEEHLRHQSGAAALPRPTRRRHH